MNECSSEEMEEGRGEGGRRGEVSSPDPSSDGGGERGRIRHCARAQEMMKFKIPALWLRLNLGAQPRARANPSPSNYWPWIDCILSLKTAVSNTTFFFFFSPLYLFDCQGKSHNQKMARKERESDRVGELAACKWLGGNISKLHATLAFHPSSRRCIYYQKKGG